MKITERYAYYYPTTPKASGEVSRSSITFRVFLMLNPVGQNP